MAILTATILQEFPERAHYFAQADVRVGKRLLTNRNLFLRKMKGADGMKTGHLSVSGFGLTASAERDGQRRILVINGLPSISSRAQEAERLMRLAFTAFDTRTVEAGDKPYAQLPVWMGESRTVGVKLSEPIKVTAHIRAFRSGKSEIVYNGPIEAPIKAGDEIAKLVITLDGKGPVEAGEGQVSRGRKFRQAHYLCDQRFLPRPRPRAGHVLRHPHCRGPCQAGTTGNQCGGIPVAGGIYPIAVVVANERG